MLPSDIQDLVNLRQLDVTDAPLKAMPRGLGNIKDLQFLSDFVVGREQEASIGELGEISNLKGIIKISKLENVKNGNEACDARMIEKKHIKSLTLSCAWYDDVEDTRTERDILGNLQPYCDLEELEIHHYRGTIFPDWLESPSYHSMTWLRLCNCKNCCVLSPLGQLPALKKLYIDRLESVVSIGDELLKGSDCASIIPFPSLEYLDFSLMTSWVEWHYVDMKAFPKLRQLHVSCCYKLVGNLPRQLLFLENLEIIQCPMLSSCIPRCPKLHNLDTCGSGNVVFQEQELPPSLCKLVITESQMLESMLVSLSKHSHLQQLIIDCCSNISPPMIHLPQSLQHLEVRWCENVNFVMSSTAPLQNLQSIAIEGCNFVKLMSDDMEGLLPNLTKLHVGGYQHMAAFPEEILVPSLRTLYIESCDKLSHQAEWHLLSNITYLRFYRCREVTCFPEGCFLPTTLTTLELNGFDCLETLNCRGLQHLTSLQHLKIIGCPKLEKMSGEKLPASLRKLHIWECPLLEEKYHNKDEQVLCRISHISVINLFKH